MQTTAPIKVFQFQKRQSCFFFNNGALLRRKMDSADTLMVVPSGFCLFCTAKTSLVCHRCGDFYCSKECQLKDWQRHRYICFAIPSLVHPMACSVFQVAELASGSAQKLQAEEATDTLLPELSVGANKQQISTNSARVTSSPTLATTSINTNECDKKSNTNVKVKNITSTKQANSNNNNNNKIGVNSNGTQKKDDLTKIRSPNVVMPPSSFSVYITDMISANRCFIRDASEAAEKAYFEICEKVDLMGKTLPKKTNIKPFEYALLQFNGRFHRVKSIGKQMSAPRLLLLDEGYVKVDKKIEMREICKELLELPFCSSQVQLKDVPNFFLNNQAHGFLKQFVGGKFIASYSEQGHVELQDLKSQMTVNAQICKFCSDMDMEIYGKNKNKSEPVKPVNSQDNKKKTDASKTPIEKCEIVSTQKQAENSTEVLVKSSESINSMSDIVKPENPQVPNKEADVTDIPKAENIQKQAAENAANSLSNCNPAGINFDQTPKRDDNQQVCDKKVDASETPMNIINKMLYTQKQAASLFLNNYKAPGNNFDQIPKSDFNIQTIKLDSKPISDVNSNENLNRKKILDDFQEKSITTIQNDNSKENANEMLNLVLNAEERKILKEYQDKYSLPIANEKPNKNGNEFQTLGLNSEEKKILKDYQENSVTTNPALTSLKEQKTISQILGPVLNPPFEMRRLSTNNKEGFDVIVVDNANASKGILGAFDSVNANDLSHLYFQLSEFRDSEPYKPILKEYVIAKYENSWYRARVIEIKQNLYTVKYLEFTNEATVTQQDIRRYPAGLTVPCHTNTCLIEGFPHRLTKRQIDFLTEKLHINSRLHIDSVSYYQDMALIKSKNLIDELNKML